MTQPKFAPVAESGEVREAYKLPIAGEWLSHRPSDYKPAPRAAHRPNTGIPGPDQGYALHLAERLRDRLELADGEHPDDVLTGATMIGLRRAALYGRAPVSHDIELALRLFGYLEGAPPEDLVEVRERLFSGIAHDYWQQRDLADLVPEGTLRLTPVQVRDALRADPSSWRTLSGLHE
jgi:hypothetical protein